MDKLRILFLLSALARTGSTLTCEECALATYTTAELVIQEEINDSGYNTKTDSDCDQWLSSVANSVTCSAANVKYGKDLAAGTEGVDFTFRCATIDVSLEYDFDYSSITGNDLVMATEERGCVAVPIDNAYTMNACYDVASNTWFGGVLDDLAIEVPYATNGRLLSSASGDNVVCLCTSDSCNSDHTAGGEAIVDGALPSAAVTASDVTASDVTDTTEEGGENGGNCMGPGAFLVAIMLVAAAAVRL